MNNQQHELFPVSGISFVTDCKETLRLDPLTPHDLRAPSTQAPQQKLDVEQLELLLDDGESNNG